jgi:hypothetical protein
MTSWRKEISHVLRAMNLRLNAREIAKPSSKLSHKRLQRSLYEVLPARKSLAT